MPMNSGRYVERIAGYARDREEAARLEREGLPPREALEEVVDAHTRYDPRAGFSICPVVDTARTDPARYRVALRTLRRILGWPTEPERRVRSRRGCSTAARNTAPQPQKPPS